jgi:hypothetical protein
MVSDIAEATSERLSAQDNFRPDAESTNHNNHFDIEYWESALLFHYNTFPLNFSGEYHLGLSKCFGGLVGGDVIVLEPNPSKYKFNVHEGEIFNISLSENWIGGEQENDDNEELTELNFKLLPLINANSIFHPPSTFDSHMSSFESVPQLRSFVRSEEVIRDVDGGMDWNWLTPDVCQENNSQCSCLALFMIIVFFCITLVFTLMVCSNLLVRFMLAGSNMGGALRSTSNVETPPTAPIRRRGRHDVRRFQTMLESKRKKTDAMAAPGASTEKGIVDSKGFSSTPTGPMDSLW